MIINIQKDRLYQLYFEEKLSARECAKYFTCDRTTILSKLRKYNIPSRSISEANRGSLAKNKGIPSKLKGRCRSEETKKKIGLGNRGKIVSNEAKRKMSKAQMGRKGSNGSKNGSWKGGISFEPYTLEFNRQLKELIRQRDNYKCQICGMPECENIRKLSVHHIDYNKKNCLPNNLISLCISCHIKTNLNRKYWKNYFSETNY